MTNSQSNATPRTNWAGNLRYSTDRVFYPETVEELCGVVRASSKIRPLGSGHCFNAIADSPVAQVSLDKMRQVVSLDEQAGTVTVEAGIRYGDLCPWLHEQGYALHNLASLPHISVIGACATGTHGSGVRNGNLSTAVSGLQVVIADGSVINLSRGDRDFAGAVVALGALGVVTELTLNVEPAYDMKQDVFLDLPLDSLFDDFDAIMSGADSVSLFTDYGPRRVNQVWLKQRLDELPADLNLVGLGAEVAENNVHPIPDTDPLHCTQQLGIEGTWYERLPHFRMEFTPSSGEELQAEYFVSREDGPDAYRALQTLVSSIQPLLLTSEVRSIAEDELWLSMSCQRPSVAFHFTLKPDLPAVKQLLPKIESTLEPFDPRPHWGKLFAMASDRLDRCYERLPDFRDLVGRYDPDGKFRNRFLGDTIFS